MRFIKESFIRAPPERVFAFHEEPNALELLLPPWESAKVLKAASVAEPGSQAVIETRLFGIFKIVWIAEHTSYNPPHWFEDVQVKGPFREWRHRHVIDEHPPGCILRDIIDYELPLGVLGRWLAPVLVERRLRRMFDYRHDVTRKVCEAVERKPVG